MAKKGKLRIAKSSLRRLILELSVDADGNKISDRILWGSKEFMEKSGLFRINKYSEEVEMVSLGTCTYWKKLLKLSAEEVFEYHQMVTQLIDPLTLFSEWNLKSNVKSIGDGVLSEKTKRNNLIRDFELSDGALYSTYTLKQLEDAIIELLDMMGENGKEELKKYYKNS